MDFKKWITEGINILKLDDVAIENCANSEDATSMALIFAAIAGLAFAVGTLNPFGIVMIVLQPVILLIFIGIFFVMAKLFGGEGSYSQLLRPIGISSMLAQWINVIPILGPILGMAIGTYLLVVDVKIIKNVEKISTGKSVMVILIPLVLCLGLFLFLGIAVAVLVPAMVHMKSVH